MGLGRRHTGRVGVSASHTYTNSGSYTIALTVTDNAGASASLTKSVTVSAPNEPPVAVFAATVNGAVRGGGSAGSTDPDGTIATYAWDWGDGTALGSGATASHTYTQSGSYTIALTVTDNGGASTSVTHSVAVTVPNQPPMAVFAATVNGASVGVDRRVRRIRTGPSRRTPGTGATARLRSGATASHTYTRSGSYTIALTVTDNGGASTSVTHSVAVTVPNQPPMAVFAATVNGARGR